MSDVGGPDRAADRAPQPGRQADRAALGPADPRWSDASTRIVSGSWAVSIGAVLLAVIGGSIMIALHRRGRAARPPGTSSPGRATRSSPSGPPIGNAYAALFRGSVLDLRTATSSTAIRPLT